MNKDPSSIDIGNLCVAASLGKKHTVKRLIGEYGAGIIDRASDWGMTALMYAAEKGQTEIAAILLENGASIEKKDRFGNAALIYAIHNGETATAALLLEKGAIYDEENKDGLTPRMIALRKGHPDIAALIDRQQQKVQDEKNAELVKASVEARIEKLKSRRRPKTPLKKNRHPRF